MYSVSALIVCYNILLGTSKPYFFQYNDIVRSIKYTLIYNGLEDYRTSGVYIVANEDNHNVLCRIEDVMEEVVSE